MLGLPQHTLALTLAGRSSDEAAALLIKSEPKIKDLLKGNPSAGRFTTKDRLIQLLKNFQRKASDRVIRNEGGRLAYRYARRRINRSKNDPDKLVQFAAALILAIDWGPFGPSA